MKSKMTARIIFVFTAIILAIYFLYPTIKLSMMTDDEANALKKENPDEYYELKSKSISLGLDLQGGMHVVLEVDVKQLMEKLAKNTNTEFFKALEQTVEIVDRDDEDFVSVFKDQLAERNMKLERYYATADRRTEEDVISFLNEQTVEAVDRSLEIMRNRIDQFGVSEPTIQKQGGRRIIIELAGVTDPDRVRGIIGKTALLEFKLLVDDATANTVASNINDFIKTRINPADTTKQEDKDKDTTSTALEELFAEEVQADSANTDSTGASTSIFEAGLFFQSPYDRNSIVVPAEKERKFRQVIDLPEVRKIIAENAGGAECCLGSR
jgi:preprotein translocase subunit SecD